MDDELTTAYDWLKHFDGSRLSPYSRDRLFEIRNLIGTQQTEHAKKLLVKTAYSPTGYEDTWDAAEFQVAGGMLAYQIQNYALAVQLFGDATYLYSYNTYYFGITKWMLGWVYYQVPRYHIEAYRSWFLSWEALNKLSYDGNVHDKEWIQFLHDRVRATLYLTRNTGSYYSINTGPKSPGLQRASSIPVSPSRPTKKSTGKPKPRSSIAARRIPIIARVPAGGLKVIRNEDIRFVELNKLMINGKHYAAYSLLDSGEINIQPEKNYIVVQVNGDSMNETGIQDEDFVLIQVQNQADHMDIVLATGLTEMEEIGVGTLKRYYHQGNKKLLYPESTNPVHQPIEINKDRPLEILGLAIAVLKPVEDLMSNQSRLPHSTP